jgi:antitoxin VapB
MSLNIKNPKTLHLARELADLTGESVTEAVTVAVEERLQRVKHDDKIARKARIMVLLDDAASRIKEPYKSRNWDEYLYDERGLPR